MGFHGVMERLTAVVAVATLPVGILTAVFVSLTAALAVFVVGWLLLVPVFGILSDGPGTTETERTTGLSSEQTAGESGEDGHEDAARDPIEELRERYASGEIDELELERRLDALLEMEDVDPDDERGIERVKETLDTGETDTEAGDQDRDTIGGPDSEGTAESTRETLTERE